MAIPRTPSQTGLKMQKPQTYDDWVVLGFDIAALFDGAPIDEEDLFAGRSSEVQKILRL